MAISLLSPRAFVAYKKVKTYLIGLFSVYIVTSFD
jgi:hypothetical protein